MLEIIDLISEALITPIYFRDPLPRWSSERVVLLGDAAHPTPPSAGQGGAMALEDAVTLAACLHRAGGPAGLPAALAEFAARRQPRTAGMLAAARINFGMFNEPDPVQMRARDGRLRGLLRTDPVGESMFGWLYGHDAIAAAQAPLRDRRRPPKLSAPGGPAAFEMWREALTLEDRSRLWLGEREGYARFLRADPSGRPTRSTVEELDAGGVPALRVVPAAAREDGRRPSPPRRRLHDGLGGGRSIGLAARGGDRRLGAGSRLPARSRAPLPGGARRCARGLPVAGARAAERAS